VSTVTSSLPLIRRGFHASNCGRSPSSGLPNLTHFSATATSIASLIYTFYTSYDRRPVAQSVLVSGHHQGPWQIIHSPWNLLQTVACLLFCGDFSDERAGLLFTVADGSRKCSLESRETQDHVLLSQFFRLPQLGGPGFGIYVPHEQGGLVIPPGTGTSSGGVLTRLHTGKFTMRALAYSFFGTVLIENTIPYSC
jgi:hypothetical protein